MKSIQLAAASGNPDPGNRQFTYMNGNNMTRGLHTQDPHSESDPVDQHDFSVHQTPVLPMDEKALSGLQARMERLKSGTLEPL